MLKLKRVDPDNEDREGDTKENEPEITVDSKGTVSLKPKETQEEKEEKAKEEAKPKEELKPIAPAVVPKAAPVAQNSTHEVVPVVEHVAKEVTTKDPSTGEEKKEVVKVPEVKNKVVPKATVVSAPIVSPTATPLVAPIA